MAVDDAVRFGCVFCGHRQDSDAVCAACKKDRTLDLRDAGVRELFRETEVRAKEQREGKAKTVGVIAGMITMLGFFGFQFAVGLASRKLGLLAIVAGFGVAFAVIQVVEKKLDRKLFPWLEAL